MRTVTWHLGDTFYACEILPGCCPFCLRATIVALPPPLLREQPDGTTHVCLPPLGGCNHGFRLNTPVAVSR